MAKLSARLAVLAASISVVGAMSLAGTAVALQSHGCSAYSYREDAQAAYDVDRSGSGVLDVDGDNEACENLPYRAVAARGAASWDESTSTTRESTWRTRESTSRTHKSATSQTRA